MVEEGWAERMDEPAESGAGLRTTDTELVRALLNRDENAFSEIVERLHGPMLRLAMAYVSKPSLAEEAVQETWVIVLQNLRKFEGRSTLRTWIMGILIKVASRRAKRERRYVRGGVAEDSNTGLLEPSVSPARFYGQETPQWTGHWAQPPRSWGENPESKLLTKQAQECIEREIQGLPTLQRAVITLRDLEQWTSEEIRNVLKISSTNERVMLHRARAKVRKACEEYLEAA